VERTAVAEVEHIQRQKAEEQQCSKNKEATTKKKERKVGSDVM
jgi:hypothetical protein